MKLQLLSSCVFLAAAFAHGQFLDHGQSPAEQQMAWAQSSIHANPDQAQPYNDLAVACVRRMRETGDHSYLERAETAWKASSDRSPNNLEAQKAHVMILLARGQFSDALSQARALNAKTPDDILTYGFIADAAIELGEYREAERSTQWMLDLREGNVPGLLRAAGLRYLYGDTDGALDFYSQAYRQIPPTQTEDQAWTLTRMAEIQMANGHLDPAADLLQSALKKFPGYYQSLESLAQLESGRHAYSQSLALLRQREEHFPSLVSQYELAQALERGGNATEANTAYLEFERKALAAVDSADNADRELVAYYLGTGNKPEAALRIATKDAEARHDIATQDEYAWALYANGHYDEAAKQMAAALSVGIRDANILYHAGAIAEQRHDRASAVQFLKESLAVNPFSETATQARAALDRSLAPPTVAEITH